MHLTIRGKRYSVSMSSPGVFLVDTPDGRVYEVAAIPDDPAHTLTAGPHAGLACDCPDFARRHAGLPSLGCKHVVALTDLGLLPFVAGAWSDLTGEPEPAPWLGSDSVKSDPEYHEAR